MRIIERFTPGTRAAMMIRATDRNLRLDCTIRPGSSTISPFARRCATHSSTFACLCVAAALANHRAVSTFARVMRPTTMGMVSVGSECESDVIVKNDSASRTVGGCDALLSTMLKPTKRGSCVMGGMSMVGRGVQLYCLSKSFLRASACKPFSK